MATVSTQETQADRKARAKKILRGLKKLYPQAECALGHGSAIELLVATILSAQSTDETVNKVMPKLLKQYPTVCELADADLPDLEGVVHATGFFRQKAKNVKKTCQLLVAEHGGGVPDTLEQLVTLPGVARKTANVVLGTWFGKNEGVVVDTHIGRLATRMALTWRSRDSKDAVRIEKDLMEVLPRKEWTYFGHAMIWHGRETCPARKPRCDECAIAKYCPSAGSFE